MREIMPYIWMGIVIFAAIVKLHTRSLAPIWLALAGFCTFVISLNEAGQTRVWVQGLIFAGLSAMMWLSSWIVCIKRKKSEKKSEDWNNGERKFASLIGGTAIVVEEINNYKNAGIIRVNGLTFGAKSEEDDIIYETGLVVTIVGIEEYDEYSEAAGEAKAVCSR